MKNILFLWLGSMLAVIATAQINVKGQVTEAATGLPLSGVTIAVKGTEQKTGTDNKGQFAITAMPGQTLILSHIGFRPLEIKAVNSFLLLQMENSSQLLQGVTVSTGYQELTKARTTGSFEKMDSAILERQVSKDILSRLDGNSSIYFARLNNTTDLSIRGLSTLLANTQPLIVLNNFPYEGDINNINPNDVESITLLKDAAAASIWGVRSGNGVLVITTKKASYVQPFRMSLNVNYTVQNKPDLFGDPNFLSPASFIETERFLFGKGFYDAALNNATSYPVISPVVEILAKQRAGTITQADADKAIAALSAHDLRKDYLDYLYRKAVRQQYALNFSGGAANMAYVLSLGYDWSRSSLVGNASDRATLAWSTTFRPAAGLDIRASINYAWSKTVANSPGGYNSLSPGAGKTVYYPYAQLINESGSPAALVKDYRMAYMDTAGGGRLYDWHYRPLEELEKVDKTTRSHDMVLGLSVKYRFLHHLVAEGMAQWEGSMVNTANDFDQASYFARSLVNKYTIRNGTGLKYGIPVGGILDELNNTLQVPSLRFQLNENHGWLKNEITAIAGVESRQVKATGNYKRTYGYNNDLLTFSAVDYVNQQLLWDKLGQAYIPNPADFSETDNRYLSVYANGSYTYNRRYTLTASARKDASNLFGVATNQKWVPLWSVGASWQLSDESFYKNEWLPVLRLRATYGYNGNVKNDIAAVPVITYGSGSPLFLPYGRITTLPNPQLRWEKNRMINMGLDFAAKGNRVSGSIDYYEKKSIDLLAPTPIDPTLGLPTMTINSANLSGKGFDAKINAVITLEPVKWEIQALLSYNKTTVTRFLNKLTNLSGYVGYGTSVILPVEGEDPYALISYKWGGLDASGDPVGYLNGVPSKDYTNIMARPTWADLVISGSTRPRFFGNILQQWSWKGFSISANVQYRLGNYFRRSSLNYGSLFNSWVGHSEYDQRWIKAGDEARTNVPALVYPVNSNRDKLYNYSEATVEPADVIRLQDINLSWEPHNWKAGWIKTVRLYLYFNNIGILWRANRLGLDPDLGTGIPVPFSISCGTRLNF